MKFIVSEVTDYEVEADNGEAALEKFLDAENVCEFPRAVRVREIVTQDGQPAGLSPDFAL